MVQDEAEDAGLLAQVKDDNDVMRQPQRRTCLDICLDCYNLSLLSRLSGSSCVYSDLFVQKSGL